LRQLCKLHQSSQDRRVFAEVLSMSEHRVCPQGHRWEETLDAMHGSVCPVCGSGAEGEIPTRRLRASTSETPANEDQAMTVAYQPRPRTDDAEASTLPPHGERLAPGEHPKSDFEFSAAEMMRCPEVEGYEILGILGRGGMGVVYKARQAGLNRLVALKMILAGEHASPEERARLRAEAEAVAQLQHPNIVQIYEVGECEGRPFLSLEFVGAGSLSQRLKSRRLTARQAAQLVEVLAGAIGAAHQRGIIHRDLKPANVLLTEDETPKITDFGLAKRLDGGKGITCSGAIMGTPAYMAPEQASGRSREIGPATDIYALGAILYEALTGRPPFQADSPLDTVLQVLERDAPAPRTLNENLDRDLEAICLKCLDKEPRHRYPSAEHLARDLHCYLEGEPISISGFNVLDQLARTLERSHYDIEFRSWGTMLLLFAAITLVEHLVVFGLTMHGPPYPRGPLTTARFVQFALMALVFWRTRRHHLLPTSAAERQLWSIWVGYLGAYVMLGLVGRELTRTERLLDELALYPMRALLSGIAFFAMGGSYWGRCYVFGLAFFLLAALMPLQLMWAPLEFGLFWSAILLLIGLRLRWMAREGAAPERK
jgi:serine/threonine protein kinase